LTLLDSTVSGNTGTFGGGGIYNGRRVWAYNSTVSGNTAYYGNGGGIWNRATGGWGRSNFVSLYNSTVSGNVAAEHGGGIYNEKYANLSVNNSTVSGNTAYVAGGGIYRYFDSMNSIVADNSAPSGANCSPGDSGGTPFSFGYNLSDDTSCGFTEPTDLVVADAMLGPLQDNGGPTETHDLLPGSPAIDAGSVDCPPPATDQRGMARPQGAACDIGAVESLSAPPPTPTPTATPTATPTPIPVRPTKAQQACVNEMNKNGEKVNRAQLKENEWCLKHFQRENLVPPMTFDGCTTADLRHRVQGAEDKTVMREDRKCDPLDPPPFAYTDSATVNAAAMDGALALLYKIFGGPPLVDANLFTRDDNPDAAKCQAEMLKQAGKVENTVLKEVNKAKRQALKDETVDSKAALAARLQAILSSNDRINKAQDRLVKGVDRKCADVQAAPGTVFPGECADPDLSEVEACVIAAARCEACLKINAFDDLKLDCDQADDQMTNGSCP
jgi:hypothetical protein